MRGIQLEGLVLVALMVACGGEERAPAMPSEPTTAVAPERPDDPAPSEPTPEPPAPRTDAETWLGAVAYPNARELCYQHITAETMHIFWKGYATPDPIATVRAFYERHRGAATLIPDPNGAGFTIQIDPDRQIRVSEAGAGHPSCGVEHAATDRTYFVASMSSH